MFGGAWYFERYQRFFAERGYENHALDLRGHHDSRPVEALGRVSISDYVEDAQTVARDLGRPIVIGHSMGGLIAQKLAEADAVAAAVLVASAPPRWITAATPLLLRKQLKNAWGIIRQKSITGAAEDHIEMTFNRLPPDEALMALSRLVPESGRAALQLSLSTVAVDERKVRCPMLGIAGLDDRFIVPRVMRSIARKYDMRLVEVPGHAHFIITEPGWEKPAGIIADWSDGLSCEPTSR
jgi:pimeloyl-ACP methyl ester carboxylesterase